MFSLIFSNKYEYNTWRPKRILLQSLITFVLPENLHTSSLFLYQYQCVFFTFWWQTNCQHQQKNGFGSCKKIWILMDPDLQHWFSRNHEVLVHSISHLKLTSFKSLLRSNPSCVICSKQESISKDLYSIYCSLSILQ